MAKLDDLFESGLVFVCRANYLFEFTDITVFKTYIDVDFTRSIIDVGSFNMNTEAGDIELTSIEESIQNYPSPDNFPSGFNLPSGEDIYGTPFNKNKLRSFQKGDYFYFVPFGIEDPNNPVRCGIIDHLSYQNNGLNEFLTVSGSTLREFTKRVKLETNYEAKGNMETLAKEVMNKFVVNNGDKNLSLKRGFILQNRGRGPEVEINVEAGITVIDLLNQILLPNGYYFDISMNFKANTFDFEIYEIRDRSEIVYFERGMNNLLGEDLTISDQFRVSKVTAKGETGTSSIVANMEAPVGNITPSSALVKYSASGETSDWSDVKRYTLHTTGSDFENVYTLTSSEQTNLQNGDTLTKTISGLDPANNYTTRLVLDGADNVSGNSVSFLTAGAFSEREFPPIKYDTDPLPRPTAQLKILDSTDTTIDWQIAINRDGGSVTGAKLIITSFGGFSKTISLSNTGGYGKQTGLNKATEYKLEVRATFATDDGTQENSMAEQRTTTDPAETIELTASAWLKTDGTITTNPEDSLIIKNGNATNEIINITTVNSQQALQKEAIDYLEQNKTELGVSIDVNKGNKNYIYLKDYTLGDKVTYKNDFYNIEQVLLIDEISEKFTTTTQPSLPLKLGNMRNSISDIIPTK